ncbi:hypothetical protein RYX36_026830 [Vicia faba]
MMRRYEPDSVTITTAISSCVRNFNLERGELEDRVTKLIKDIKNLGDLILFIDEVHTLVQSGTTERGSKGSGFNIANLLKPSLVMGLFQCIASTTMDEYRLHFKKDKALARRFQPDWINEPSEDDAINILMGIPVQQLTADESSLLLDLDNKLREQVIGLEEVVSSISRAMKRCRVGLKDPSRPIATLLFCGPTGYVGYGEGGILTKAIRRNPFTVLLFDEIEKAHSDIFNILLQLLEDGHLTDSQGRRVSFKNALVVMTSNVGSSAISKGRQNSIGFLFSDDKLTSFNGLKSMVMEELRAYFSPELLNRIDEVVVFHPLEKPQLLKILDSLLQ